MFCKKIPIVNQIHTCRCADIKWITPEQGLPDTDREVLVIVEKYDIYSTYATKKRSLSKSKFDPSSGWMGGCMIFAWKEIDCETKRLLTV